MARVLYSAVVLDEASIEIIKEKVVIPKDFLFMAHHCTIVLGELPEDWKGRIGEEVSLNCDSIGMTDKALALKVSNFKRLMSGTTHITVAINEVNGGKPKDSNLITDWSFKLPTGLILTGTIQEVTS